MANAFGDDLDVMVRGQATSPMQMMFNLGPNASQAEMDDLNNLAYTQLLERGAELDSFDSSQTSHPSLKGWIPQWGPASWNGNTLSTTVPAGANSPSVWGNQKYIPQQTFHQQGPTGHLYNQNPNAGLRFTPAGMTNPNNAYGVWKGSGTPQQNIQDITAVDNAATAFNKATGMGHATLYQGQPTLYSKSKDFGIPNPAGGSRRVFEGVDGKPFITSRDMQNWAKVPAGADASTTSMSWKENPNYGTQHYVTIGAQHLGNQQFMNELQGHERTHTLDAMLPKSSEFGYVRGRGHTGKNYSYGDGPSKSQKFTGPGSLKTGNAWLKNHHVKGSYQDYYDKHNDDPNNQFMRPAMRDATSNALALLYTDKKHYNNSSSMVAQGLQNRGTQGKGLYSPKGMMGYAFSPSEQFGRGMEEFVKLKNLSAADRTKSFKGNSLITKKTYDGFENMFKVMNKGTYGFN